MRTSLQLENTVDPPAWRVVGDTYDPLTVAFSANTVAGSPFTSANFDNGDGLSQSLFGPLRFCKDGWIAYIAGIFTVPTLATGEFDIELCQLPAAYVPLGYWGMVPPAVVGIWNGAETAAISVVDNAARVRINNLGTGFQDAQWGTIALSWPTGTYGE